MNLLKTSTLLTAVVALATSANAATWNAKTFNGGLDDTSDWDAGGTSPLTAMNVDNDDTWVIDGTRMFRGDSHVFFGTLQVSNTDNDDGEFFNRESGGVGSSFEAIILDGGALNNFLSGQPGEGITADTVSVTANGGTLGGERETSQFGFGSISGSGNIFVTGRANGAPSTTPNSNTTVRLLAGKNDLGTTDYSGFSGTFIVQEVTGNTDGYFGFNEDVTSGTFGLEVQAGGTYNLANDVTVTSLTLGSDTFGAGTYTFTDFTLAQQAFFNGQNDGGTLIVAIPEPGSLALLAVGGMCMMRRRRA